MNKQYQAVLSQPMVTGHHPPGYSDFLQVRAGKAAGFIGRVFAYKRYFTNSKIEVYALYQNGVAHGNDIYSVALGLSGVEYGNVAVVNAGINHAVARDVNGFKVFGPVGAY